MGLPVLIYGKSGSGKSRSLKFFAEDEVVLFNTERKALLFRKRFENGEPAMTLERLSQQSTRIRRSLRSMTPGIL